VPGRLEGKAVVITGTGGGGTGRAAALRFAAEGARVVGCDIVGDGAEETVQLVRAAGGEMVSLQPCDLTDPRQAAALVALAVDTYSRIDVLYNNAATGHFAPVGEMTFEQFQYTMDRLVTIVFHTTDAAWPHLVQARGGTIVNTASVGGMRGSKGNGALALAAGKGGIIAMTRQLASEGGRHGIRANSISPGFVETPVTRELLRDDAFRAAVEDKLMLGRWGQPQDIAGAALFLASDESSWITGANLVIDGGASAW
jgi:NAD(P)-dependent dehydrogenase (short-subunit alcohol dehydrogenase family)